MHTLYHYIHCPFCLRLRFVFGYLGIPYNSQILDYDDEKTPIELTGQKMLPIVKFPNGEILNESLEIIKRVDLKNNLNTEEILNSLEFSKIEGVLNKLGTNIHNLAMPYFIFTPEFTESARAYFQTKKEMKRGPFKDLYKKRELFISELNNDLSKLMDDLNEFYLDTNFTLKDILLASHLWALYIVPEFQFPLKIHEYLQRIKKLTNFEYHRESWL